jgi:hypothetical protein
VNVMDDAISRRAMAFARTFKWVNPRITAGGPAPAEIVDLYGTAGSTDYGQVDVEMKWSEAEKSRILANVSGDDRTDAESFVQGPIELRVVCSASDVIHHEFPRMDLD